MQNKHSHSVKIQTYKKRIIPFGTIRFFVYTYSKTLLLSTFCIGANILQ
ncbi:hypothetical protein PIN17_A1840 [Prevotella intermedia 17]|nr:hypothetical protein PIN17_A1840 [Prevotella intermedia 17]